MQRLTRREAAALLQLIQWPLQKRLHQELQVGADMEGGSGGGPNGIQSGLKAAAGPAAAWEAATWEAEWRMPAVQAGSSMAGKRQSLPTGECDICATGTPRKNMDMSQAGHAVIKTGYKGLQATLLRQQL